MTAPQSKGYYIGTPKGRLIHSQNFMKKKLINRKITNPFTDKYFIMMHGLPGSGKTFVAQFIAEQLDYNLLNADNIKRLNQFPLNHPWELRV